MASSTPDAERDVIVRHIRRLDAAGLTSEQWHVFVGSERRGMADSPDRAFVFARLLADLVKRPVWIQHEADGLQPLDPASIRGCSCC
jgi:hypothetical protein